jgi:spore coat polysaccharide biosynthesis protein SpsF
MTVLALVQARLGSTRLPDKVLEPLAGEPVLVRIVERVRRASRIDAVAVVLPDGPRDEPLRELCRERAIPWHAGSELDVLDRFHQAIGEQPTTPDVVVRITADCPLLDPAVLDALIDLHESSDASYTAVATGAHPAEPGIRRYPDGLDAEAIAVSALEDAWAEARASDEREHVTLFLYRRPQRFRLARLQAPADLGAERWTIDYPEDLEFVRAVYERLGPEASVGDVLALLAREPALRALNARHAPAPG